MPARSLIPAAAAASITAHAAALGLVWLASSQSSPTTLDLSNGASDSAPDGAVAMLWPTLPTPTPPAPLTHEDPAPTPRVEVTAAPIDPSPAMQELELLPELAQTPDPTPQPQDPRPTPAAAPTTDALVPITLDPEAFRAVAAQLRQTAASIASTLAAFRLPSHPAPAQSSASAAPASAASSVPATSGGQVSSPSPASTNKAPPYPYEARRRHQQGTATILIEVLPTGLVGEVSLKTSSGFPLLDTAALAAAKAWHFSPAKLENTPVHCQVTLPIEFSLK